MRTESLGMTVSDKSRAVVESSDDGKEVKEV